MMRKFTLLLALASVLMGPQRGLGQGFGPTATRWEVPVGGSAGAGFNSPYERSYLYSRAARNWTTLDLNGDHRPDLIVTGEHSSGSLPVVLGGVATPHWEVYLGTAGGFAPTATRWAVPVGGSPTTGFMNVDNSNDDQYWALELSKSAIGQQSWTVMDLNNDGRLDLVVHSEGDGTKAVVRGGVAAPHWEVYLNTGSGFATTATRWAVPVGGSPTTGFNERANFLAQYPGEQNWNLCDLDGDGRIDLIVTSEANGSRTIVLGGLANQHWDVYLGTANGFAATATRWTVPVGGYRWEGFAQMSGSSRQYRSQYWDTADMNGDHRLDLVVTHESNGTQGMVLGGVAAPHWEVYLNTGTGFASTATRWALPGSMAAAGGFDGWDGTAVYVPQAGKPSWGTTDMNGDGRSDLVVQAMSNGSSFVVLGGLTAPYWDIYLNTGSGYAATATRWTVPVGGSPIGGFNSWSGATGTQSGVPVWSVQDMNRDDYPDLTVCSQGNGTQSVVLGGVATPYWEVYYGDATGLRPAPPVAYPTIFSQTLTLEASGSVGQTYTILDGIGHCRRQGRIAGARQVLELGELAAGLYFIRIDGAEKPVLRIVKQ